MAALVVIAVPQIDGTRYLALRGEDAEAVRRDRAMLDAVRPLACLDIASDGTRDWVSSTPEGRRAIHRELSLRSMIDANDVLRDCGLNRSEEHEQLPLRELRRETRAKRQGGYLP